MAAFHDRPVKIFQQQGVGLIEVLVAVVVLALGLLGVAALQANSLKSNQSANERSMAVILNYSIIDAMRANVEVARVGGYNYSPNVGECNRPAAGSQANNDIRSWLDAIETNLGVGACGEINCALGICNVTIQWDDSRGIAGDVAQTIVTEVRL